MAASPRGELLALLADVKENPREDGLRLILADWLEENGSPLDQARADLIRAQIDLGRLSADDPARSAALGLARALQHRHGRGWLGPLADRLTRWSFTRGLLCAALTVPALRARSTAALAETEAWAWVEEVQPLGCEDADVVSLAGSRLLAQVASIDLHQARLGPAGAQALAAVSWLARLDRLNLSNQTIGDRGLAALLRSPHLSRLRGLALGSCGLTTGGADLATSAPALEWLTLWGNPLGNHAAAVCGGSLRRLRSLDLRMTGLGDAGACRLAACPGLATLAELDLADNGIGPDGARALAASPHLRAIGSLVLWGNPVGAEMAGLLQGRFGSRVHVSPVPE